MNSIIPDKTSSKFHNRHFVSCQHTGMMSRIHLNNKMDANCIDSANDLRSIPPLIPMEQIPPLLCCIPNESRSTNQYALIQSSDSQGQENMIQPLDETYQTSAVPNSSPIYRTTQNSRMTMTHTRKRKVERSNRELILMVKQQLHQLNQTLEALERHSDYDNDIPPGQLTPPNDVTDQTQDTGIHDAYFS